MVTRELINIRLTPTTNHQELSTEENQQQLQRILHSNTLRNSLTLQQLLQYLATRVIEGRAEGLKEYTIGLEAFGRKPDFDPKTDTIVRVQTHRLRQKLKEYYKEEGIQDPVVVDIPRGHYHPTFQPRAADPREQQEPDTDELSSVVDFETTATAVSSQVEEKVIPDSASSQVRRYFPGPITVTALLILTLIIGYFFGNSQVHRAITGNALQSSANRFTRQPADPVKAFWAVLLGSDPSPIIAYPNAVFLLDDSNDLFRFRQGASDNRGARVDSHLARQFASNPTLVAKAGQLYYEDGYTGTGELESVAMLTTLFAQMGLKPLIKTSRNITPDDLQQHTVILLGSPFQNIAVAQLLAVGDFTFQNPDSRREQWRAQIVNTHPEPNENPIYHTERDPDTEVLKRDYSIISIQPGVVEGHNIAVIGGLDTKGTEGATRFITSRAGVAKLSTALAGKGLHMTDGGATAKEDVPSFQALILVHLDKGDQVLRTELTALHPLPLKK